MAEFSWWEHYKNEHGWYIYSKMVEIFQKLSLWEILQIMMTKDVDHNDDDDEDDDDDDNHHGAGNAIVSRSQTAIESKTMFVGLLMLRIRMIMMIMRKILRMMRMRRRVMMRMRSPWSAEDKNDDGV